MRRRRPRSRARALGLALLSVGFALALVLFPLTGRGAGGKGTAPAASGSAAKAAASGAPAASASPAAAKGGAAKGAKGATEPPAAEPPHEAAPAAAREHATEGDKSLTELPLDQGLPIRVNVGVFFLSTESFDDTKGEFECTTDLRLRWTDARLRFAAADKARGYKEYRGKEAEEQLAKIWAPTLEVTNRLEGSSYVSRQLRIYPDGKVESLTRQTAKYKTQIDAETFPFDRQHLVLDMQVREATTDEVLLRFEKDDVEFSKPAKGARLPGWDLGLVDLKGHTIPGWDGDHYSRATASLFVDRVPTTSLAPIFIPLLASLLIPLLAIWMNKADDEGFEVDAFELANMSIGGLFSVIALSFAIYSSYGVIAGGDNTVTRLFGLNYAMLAISLAVVILWFRYNVLAQLFGHHVQREAYHYLAWALPLLSLATSIAFLLIAAA